jgi:hypothetical protein
LLDEANWRDIANKIEIQIVIERGVVCIRSCDRAISRLPATPSAVLAGVGPSVVKVIDLFSQATTHVISTGGAKRGR